MEKFNNKENVMITIILAIILLVSSVGTLAFFKTESTSIKQNVIMSSDALKLTFTDIGDSLINDSLKYGETNTKLFKIVNSGNHITQTNLLWDELINTFLSVSLSYTLEISTDQSNWENLETYFDYIPYSKTQSTHNIATNINVPVGESYLRLTIKLEYLEDVDQTQDLYAQFSSKFKLNNDEIKEEFNIPQAIIAMENNEIPIGVSDEEPIFDKISPYPTIYNQNEENNGTLEKTDETINYYIAYSNSKSFNSETGNYTLNNIQIGIYSDVYLELAREDIDYYILDINGTETEIQVDTSTQSTIYKVESDTTLYTLSYTPLSSNPAEYVGSGIYYLDDDYGVSYFYRGDITNNYVKFGGFYWRIIRINGDGSIRMVYDGTQAWENGTASTNKAALTSRFDTGYYDVKYLGYMYGASEPSLKINITGDDDETKSDAATYNEISSVLKSSLDTWYENNILINEANDNADLSTYLADVIFCNDRTISKGVGYGYNLTEYNTMWRATTEPTLICAQENDQFTTTNSNHGNKALKYPIGTITVDDVRIAGGYGIASYENSKFYLYSGYKTWTMSPFRRNDSGTLPMHLAANGSLSNKQDGRGLLYVRPVINLSKEVSKSLIGTGKIGDEYRLSFIE